MIRHGTDLLGCEGCAEDALEVADGYAVFVESGEAEVVTWRCGECGSDGRSVLRLGAEDLHLVA